MRDLLVNCIEVIITLLESYLAYEVCCIISERVMSLKAKLTFSIILTCFIFICNSKALFSIFTLTMVILIVTVTINIYFKMWVLEEFLNCYLYYLFVYIIDFFSASLIGLVLKQDNLIKNIASTTSIERCLFLLLSKLILIWTVYLLKKYKNNIKRIGQKGALITTIIATMLTSYLTLMSFKNITLERVLSWFMIFSLVVLLYTIFIIYQKYICECNNRNMINMRNDLISQRYMELLSESQAYAKLHHDSRNHMSLVINFIEHKKYLELEEYIKIMIKDIEVPQITWTGNEIVDFILSRKKKTAENLCIKYLIAADPIPKFPVNDNTLNIVLSNLLDNAIEACNKIQSDDKWIKISIRCVHSMVFIIIENSLAQTPVSNGKLFKTTKVDAKLHGWGLKSVNEAVKESGGAILFSYNNTSFKVSVSFY